MFGFFKKAIKMAEEQEERNSKDYEIKGFRKPNESIDGDDTELEFDPSGGWKVIHEDHHIGWIHGVSEDQIDNADEIKIKIKDGKAFVRIVAEE